MVRRQQAADRAQRPKMSSPGRWGFARSVERGFWLQIADGKRTAQAAEAVGVSEVIGTRWFRNAGGMPPMSLAERSRSFARKVTDPERSVAGSAEMPRRSRGSCAEMRPLARPILVTGPRPRSGKLRSLPDVRSRPSWRRICGCVSTCRTVWLDIWCDRTERSSLARTRRGPAATNRGEPIGPGQRHGARSRSPTGSELTSPMMNPCGSVTRRSIRRSTFRAAER